jgi:hypothetical protein
MPEISATFKSTYSESRRWIIWDQGRDPNSPPTIFDGYLGSDDVTGSLTIYSADGTYGKIAYQRSDGPVEIVDDVTDGSQVSME